MHSPLAIANEFLRRAKSDGRRLTQMQLQKLVYLAHGWCLAVTGEPLIEDEFEAWEFGPVERKLYQALRRYGSGPVSRPIRWGDDSPFADDLDFTEDAFEELDEKESDVVDRVWANYGRFPAHKLSALTHEPGTPWTNVFEPGRNRPVSNNAIQEYFIRLADTPQA
jgi:uncharacterized phage-associated protein